MIEILYIIAGSLLTLGASPVVRRFGSKARERQERETRLWFLRRLLSGGACLGWIAEEAGLDETETSLHLERMVEECLLRKTKGSDPVYSLTDDGRQLALWGAP
jgi:DNA-binding MarR family transcriptional regulator